MVGHGKEGDEEVVSSVSGSERPRIMFSGELCVES
jgi:hypothetical protein